MHGNYPLYTGTTPCRCSCEDCEVLHAHPHRIHDESSACLQTCNLDCEVLINCRLRSDDDGLGASSRSPSLTFPTRASLPQPDTPMGIPVTPLTANGRKSLYP